MSHIDDLKNADILDPARELRILARNFDGDDLNAAVARRANREPMSHILGYRDFWRDRFIVTKDVLDPRPDSELFIELALKTKPNNILDLGCGSGALGLSALREHPSARCTFVDVSPAALENARLNAGTLGLADRCTFIQSNWLENVKDRFNLLLCNPPYISEEEMLELEPELDFEPRLALTPEGDGLEPYRILAPLIDDLLLENGVAFFEHGATQQDDVGQIFRSVELSIQNHQDLANKPRIVQVYRY